MASIELRGISKSFGGMVGVEHLDLEVRDEALIVPPGPPREAARPRPCA